MDTEVLRFQEYPYEESGLTATNNMMKMVQNLRDKILTLFFSSGKKERSLQIPGLQKADSSKRKSCPKHVILSNFV